MKFLGLIRFYSCAMHGKTLQQATKEQFQSGKCCRNPVKHSISLPILVCLWVC